MGIAVVTSVWGTYGRYLEEWARSIAGQTVKPDEVVIADLGGCNGQWGAAKILADAGIQVMVRSTGFTTMGAARNVAVKETRSEWVMHLDADDQLLPGALASISRLTDRADVISMCGRYPNGKTRNFPRVSARTILSGRVGCFSCSPFRRTLWERSPYPTDSKYVDRLLWIGFAHQGARFVPMREPGFVYRQHPDSFRRTLGPAELDDARRQIRRAIRHG